MTTTVDEYLEGIGERRPVLEELRRVVVATGLTEGIKWRRPCYTHGGGNVVLLGEMKAACVLSFPKGALLADPAGILVKPGPNSRAARKVHFTTVDEVRELESTLTEYIDAAIGLERAGAKVDFTKGRDLEWPAEMHAAFEAQPALGAAFRALTPGRQRGYVLHFAGAKQSSTRTSRIEGCKQRIMNGKGIHDCICGRSKRMPNCDGSHRQPV